GGHNRSAAMSGPGDEVPGNARSVDPLDPRRVVVLVEVAVGAAALSVVDAGGATGRDRLDVVVLTHGRIAEGGAAGAVAPVQEAFHRRRELPPPGFDRDQLPRGGMGVQASQ